MLEIGSLIDGKYKILNEVGHGGMSVVYLAMNERANKQWAIKEVRKDGVKDFEVVKQSLVAETNMLKKLSHPSLPDIVDVIDEDDRFLIVMDYIEGNSLKTALQEYGAQSQKNVIKWAKQLCDVLGYLHSQNPPIIYRDMKPANIMLKPDGNVVLIDFGTAREYKENNIEDTTCLGTMGYAAPEQFGGMGQTDARTDIYCLGATMYHLVTGMNPCEPPYEIRPIREIDPTLSGGLERIITKCTQPDPNNRYQSAAELMYDLEHYTEIDDMYRKNLKRKLAVFITTSVLTMLLGTSTVLSYCAAEHKKNENYNSILKEADTYDNYDNGYYTAIVTDPTRTEAYLKLNDKLTDDFVLDRDEAQILNRLMVGIDCKDHNGRVHTYDVMAKLKEKNPKGYEDVCYKIGESFLFYYEINVEKDRYSSAAQWFKEVKENHPEAGIYCEISDCLTLISQYDGAKIQQTEKTYEEYKKLWKQINELYAKSENFDSLDAKIQVWNEIDDIVDTNITSFIAVTDCQTLKTKAGNIQAKVDSKITEYYKERFYSVDSNGKTVMNWDEINYEMRKEFVPDAELQALVSVFPKLSTDDEEETIANIENMLRAGYGNAKDDEWIDNADLEDPKYYSVSVTNTFKRAVDIYKTSMDIIDYYSEKCAYRNDEISDEALEEMKEQYRVSSLFKAMVDSYPTIGVAYNGKNDGFTIHSDREKNVTISVCLKELPFDVSICKITDSNDREILDKYYNVKVTNGTINEKVGKENEKVNQIDAYGMVDNQIVSHVLPHGMIENTKQNLENQKEEEKTECRVFFDVTSNTLKGKIIDEAIGLSAVIINETVGDKINKANAAINYLNDLNAAYDENNENVQNNAEIDEAKDRLTETDFTCQDMIEDANYFGMDMEITRVGDTYICDNITMDVEKVTKMVDAYNAQAKPKQQVSIDDLEDYARGAGDKNQREDDESYDKLCRRVSNYIKYVIKN